MTTLTSQQAGTVRAWYVSHQSWLLGRLRRRLDSRADAEDVAADTFLEVLGHPDPGTVHEPRAFLATIARRLLFHRWRRADLERTYLEMLAAQPQAFAPSPEERAVLLESLTLLAAALDTLSERARRAFLYSQLDGLTCSARQAPAFRGCRKGVEVIENCSQDRRNASEFDAFVGNLGQTSASGSLLRHPLKAGEG